MTTEETIAEVEEYLPEFAARYGLDLEMMREAQGSFRSSATRKLITSRT